MEPTQGISNEQIIAALQPFAQIGAWLFARDLPDETPVVEISGLLASNSNGLLEERIPTVPANRAMPRARPSNDLKGIDDWTCYANQDARRQIAARQVERTGALLPKRTSSALG